MATENPAFPATAAMAREDMEAAPSIHDNDVVEQAPARPKEASCLLLGLLCSIASLEGADMMILPSVSLAIQVDLGLSLTDLSQVMLFQALCQTLVAPFWGILADSGLVKRKHILTFGCIVNGLVTMSVSLVHNSQILTVCRALNGAMLASLRPVSNGVVADVTDDTKRGKAFGWVMLALNLGSMSSGLICTNLSRQTIFHVEGWRVACVAMGAYGICIGLLVLSCVAEPPREVSRVRKVSLRGEFAQLLKFLRLPTFAVMVIQGCFGMVPINAFSYRTLYFQVAGLGDNWASALQAGGQAVTALGNLFGGLVGDWFAKKCPMHGRVFVAQITIMSGVPIVFLTFMVSPPESMMWSILYFGALLTAFGLVCTWCATGVNWPILTQIVPPENRNAVMAWETALEGSCGSIFGNVAVGYLAKVFGYDLHANTGSEHIADPISRAALGKALTLTTFFPYLVCFAFYSLLHWSYPRDLRSVAAQKEEAAARQREQLEAKPSAPPAAQPSLAEDAAGKQDEVPVSPGSVPRLWVSAQKVADGAGVGADDRDLRTAGVAPKAGR